MSKFSRKREMEEIPPLGTRIITGIQRRTHWIGVCLGTGVLLDILKHWIGGKAMDWLFNHFGVLGIFLLSYKFAILTLAIILVLLWLAWVALREANVPRESLLTDEHCRPLKVRQVSRGWAIWFSVGVTICILFVGYGVWDYYRSSFLLNTYPLGYVIFDMDTVTGAVAPSETRRGLEAYQFDFRPVRILENTPTHIAIELPDLLKNHQLILTGAGISGDRATMQQFGAGYAFSDGEHQIMATGQVLRYEGERIVWILGFRRMAPFHPLQRSIEAINALLEHYRIFS